jgi:putative ubiquitin-RnfH superfamily antitoxin RatB of RatAB toxin-antitoxin module
MAPSTPERLAVRVVYAPAPTDAAPAPRPWVVDLELAGGACVGDAVAASGLLQRLDGTPLDALDLGVFNRRCSAERLLQDGDRVEIYRPLRIDPKDARHLRVQARRKAEAQARQAARTPGGAADGGKDRSDPH